MTVPATLVATFSHFVSVPILNTLAVTLARVPHMSAVPISDVSIARDISPASHLLCPLIAGHAISIGQGAWAVVREVARAPTFEAVSVAGATDSLVIHPHGLVIREGGGCPGSAASSRRKASAPASWRPLRH